ncbi:MAG: hypothetical protein ACFFD2_14615, partial [Promethearchaeota archaeon]
LITQEMLTDRGDFAPKADVSGLFCSESDTCLITFLEDSIQEVYNLEVIVELISLTNSDHNYFIPIDMKQAEKIDNTPYYQFTFRQNLPIKSSDDKVTIYLKLPSLSKNIDSVEINDIFTIPDNNNFPIIFICALPKEQETLLIELDKLTNLIKKKTKSGCIELYQHKLSEIKAIINCIEGTGNILSKNKTKDLIEKYNPQLVILFGIAAGIKGRVKLRELLITNKVWDLRKFMIEQKHNEQKYYEFEPESIISPKKLSSLFQIKKLKELLDNIFEEDIKIHTDLICGSSNNLIRDENFMIDASRTHRKLGMIEMEAIGVAEICNSYDIPFFIVKSISDYGNINKSDDLHSFCCDLAASSVLYGFLIPDEIDSILKYPENLEKLKKNSQIFKKLDKYEIRKIHLFLDEINNLLDTQFPVIKEKFFPNIWKIGIKISKTEQDDRLRYSFNPISWDVNEILIKEISPLEWIKGVKKNFFLEWGSINKEIILEEPKKYAIGVLSRIIKEIFDNKALYHQGNIFLANEFIFAAINKFKLQLGLEEKNEYTVDEIEKGLEIYLPLWVQQATKTISKDILFNMFKRNGYYDPKFMLFSCHKFQQDWINQRIKDKLSQIPLKIPNIPFENTEMPFRILREFLSFLKKRGVEKVHRLYRPPDYSRMKKPADLIYNKYEPEDLERNIRLFFQNLIPSYNTLLKNNFPELKDKLPYFYGATKILVEIDLKKYYHSRYDVPTKTVLYLKNKEVTDLSVDILLKSEGNIPDDVFVTKTLEYKGKNYSVLAGSFGILDFIFQDLPMFDTVYKILIDNLGRYLGFDTSEFSLKGFS